MDKILKLKPMVFSDFSDGEIFTHDQGRAQKIGEVFTPKEIVDLMIFEMNMNRAASDYTIFEPGVGTGNFTCEILFCKLNIIKTEITENYPNKLKDLKSEFEIKSLLALASITFNDIDESNIERVKNRLYNIMISFYKNYLNTKRVKNCYLTAITNILHNNAIIADFISEEFGDELFVRYIRTTKTTIIRCVYKFVQIYKNDLFINDEPIFWDKIDYRNWTLEISNNNIHDQNLN